jgi:hypothetical protein
MSQNHIVEWLKRNGISEIELDEIVHEAAMGGFVHALNQEVKPSSQESILQSGETVASDVNNAGLTSQVEFLIGHFGADKLAAERIAGELDLDLPLQFSI